MSGYFIRYQISICTIERAVPMYSVAMRAQVNSDNFSTTFTLAVVILCGDAIVGFRRQVNGSHIFQPLHPSRWWRNLATLYLNVETEALYVGRGYPIRESLLHLPLCVRFMDEVPGI